MKGRSNYLCLHRYQAMRSGGLPRQQRLGGFGHPGTEVDERILLPILERWVARTTTGDRAELRDLPEDLPIWSELSASAENCLGTTCPQFNECYVTQMRQRAADSDLVIVNHHLLFADAAVRQGNYGAVIPDRDVAILDEAHQLEDVATNYFGLSVSNYRIDDLTRDIERALDAWPAPERRDAVKRMTARVEDRARHFFEALQPRRRAGEDRVRVTPDALTDVQPLGQALIGTLEGVEAQLQLLKSAPSEEAGAVRPAVLDDLIALAARVAELRQELTVLLRASDPDFVFFLETRGRGLFLRAAPIDVSRIVRDEVVDHFKATVLTSATLAVDGGFDYVRGRLGIRGAEEARLLSEFDYARQAILYLPRRMPLPRDPGFAEAAGRECLEILRRTQGRAFVLFTSYAMLRAVEPLLRLGLTLSVAGAGHSPARRAARRVPAHAKRRAPGDVELLAGRRRRRRPVELRDHRQAAVCLARRSGDGRADGSAHGGRRRSVCRLPGAAGHPCLAAGPGTADPAPDGSRRAGDSRPTPEINGLWPAIPGVAASRPGRQRPGRHRTVLRGWRVGPAASRQALPMRMPDAKTSAPPSTTCSAALQNGVSM